MRARPQWLSVVVMKPGGGFFVLRHRRYLELSILALRLAFGVHVRAILCREVVVE
jgi:hypothetical protein